VRRAAAALGLLALLAGSQGAGAQEIGGAAAPPAGPGAAGAGEGGVAPGAGAGAWLASLRVDRLAGGGGDGGEDAVGGRVEVGRLWRRPDGATLGASAEAFRLSDVEWLAGRLLGTLPLSAATTLHGGGTFGPGRERGEDLTYLELRAGATRRLGTEPLFATVEDLYLEVGNAHGNLVKGTLTAGFAGGHLASLTYGRSTGGNLGFEYASVRWDGGLGGRRALAGFSFGDSRPEVLGLFDAAEATRFEEAFAGVVLETAQAEVTLVLAYQEVADLRRTSLTVSLRLPHREAAR